MKGLAPLPIFYEADLEPSTYSTEQNQAAFQMQAVPSLWAGYESGAIVTEILLLQVKVLAVFLLFFLGRNQRSERFFYFSQTIQRHLTVPNYYLLL